MDVDWTEDEARNAEACYSTDLKYARFRGFSPAPGERFTIWSNGDEEFVTSSPGCAAAILPLPNQLKASSTAEGAHRAREWLRGQKVEGHPLILRADDRSDGDEIAHVQYALIDDAAGLRTVDFACAPTEHLATARLVLTLAAEGVLDDADAPGGDQ